MKILLMVPPYIDKISVPGTRFENKVEDLGLGYIKSYLEFKGFEDVSILHCPIDNVNENNIIEYISNFNPDIIGISISFESTDLLGGYYVSKIAKEYNKEIIVFAGGHAATFMAEEILNSEKNIDYIVLGEGEKTTYELIDAISNKKDIGKVKGIVYRKEDEIIHTEANKLIEDLDELPFPDRSIYNKLKPDISMIETSRGCWGKCKFCSVPVFFKHGKGRVWRSRSVEKIVDEMEILIKTWGINKFDFIDDNFLGIGKRGKEKVDEFYKLVIERKLKIEFFLACRVESVDYDSLLKLKEIGLKRIFVGIESGCDETLNRFGKNTSTSINKQAIEVIKKLDIEAKLCMIMFDPWLTIRELKETIYFIYDINSFNMFHWSSILNEYRPFVGTEMQNKLFYQYGPICTEDNFDYVIEDKSVENIRYICREISKTIKYLSYILLECNYDICLHNEFDKKLSKVIVLFIKKVLDVNDNEFGDRYIFVRDFYNIITKYTKSIYGDDVYEKIEERLKEL